MMELMVSALVLMPLFFFFSSGRRHTSCYRDWSSDVCSSDLSDDQRWAVVGLGLQKRLERMLVARAHRHAGDVDVAVSHGDQAQVFFRGALAADGELGHSRARRGLGHLAAGVRINFGIEHED